MMLTKKKKIFSTGLPGSFLLSVVFHFIIYLLSAYLVYLKPDKTALPVYLTLQEYESSLNTGINDDISEEIKDEQPEELYEDKSGNISGDAIDTSGIEQLYKEYTRNVSVRYPNGWTYIDQNVKNKLDGVTFWSLQTNYEVAPYVHLEVQNKNLFNPSRWKFNFRFKGNTYYYNDAQELEGYFNQIIYIRTDTDEDYSLKLIVKGNDVFQSVQPVFFNMAKSLEFGNSFF